MDIGERLDDSFGLLATPAVHHVEILGDLRASVNDHREAADQDKVNPGFGESAKQSVEVGHEFRHWRRL